ncbi:hypothetical protein EST92_23075 [Streptomyces sp. TM32]|uniref:hypothetical protein n=1 Tax=Streptomyces sp. TM32 TaxID=1652669 RepID=UPI0010113913|nr:hypothetical protein [Streptomyces sp. TM32]RXS72655.1 hypothetical protein EST92_23075 [Streptomyces sp. TM32]
MTPRVTTDVTPRATTEEPAGYRADLRAAAAGLLLVTAAAVVGTVIERSNGSLHVNWPPLYASWFPHLGPGTPAALAVGAAVILHGPSLAARLPWRRLVLAGWVAALAWTWSLALIDGWQTGIARRLTTAYEYLTVIRRFDDAGAAVRDFTRHILNNGPDHWPAHVAGHPPAAVLTFVGLDRIGLGGGGWAGVWCLTVGTSAVAAVLVALRALTDEPTARRAAPFLVLAPSAVWVGTSADGYFAAVAAWPLALLALAATRRSRHPAAAALASGVLFGLACYLSYGLTLIAVIAGAVLWLTRTLRPLPFLAAGAGAVAAAFTLAGFSWWEGYQLLVERYYQGAAGVRPYAYWVWGNLACTVLITGLATVAGVRRTLVAAPTALRGPRPSAGPPRDPADRLVVLVLSVLLAVLVADLSGMSKAETERVWLPFAAWLPAACALLPAARQRHWLAAQAVLALLLNHLLYTGW